MRHEFKPSRTISLSGGPYSFAYLPNIRYGTAPGLAPYQSALYLDLLVPEPHPAEPVPTIVSFEGPAWESTGARADMLTPWGGAIFAAHGFIAARASFTPASAKPFPAQVHDAKAAVRFLRAHAGDYGIDPDQIGVCDSSAGGHLAALLGTSEGVEELEGPDWDRTTSSAVQAVVAWCAPSDFLSWGPVGEPVLPVLERLFGGPLEDRVEPRRLASPVHHVRPGAPPFLLVHGDQDETVPYQQSVALSQALRAAGAEVRLRTIPGGHHNMVEDEEEPWGPEPWADLAAEALQFFTEHLTTEVNDRAHRNT